MVFWRLTHILPPWESQTSRVVLQFKSCDEFCGTPYTERRSQGQPPRASWPYEGCCCEDLSYRPVTGQAAALTALVTANEIIMSSSIRVNELFLGCLETGTTFNSTADAHLSSSVQAIFNRKRKRSLSSVLVFLC
jgi:hypothetical protein